MCEMTAYGRVRRGGTYRNASIGIFKAGGGNRAGRRRFESYTFVANHQLIPVKLNLLLMEYQLATFSAACTHGASDYLLVLVLILPGFEVHLGNAGIELIRLTS